MSDTQSPTPQPRALHIELHQSAGQDALLIRCKASGGSREAKSTDPDLSSKTMGLELLAPTGTTAAREICC
jgi:hypothetical protein